MSFLQRRAWLSLLALLTLIVPLAVLAQEDVVQIDGSRIVADIVEPISTAYTQETGATVNLEISGTSSGLARLCNGEIDIATAARPITREEEQACAENGVEWVEVLLGYDTVAIIANPAFTQTECLTFADLSILLGPSATATITNLTSISPSFDNIDFTFYAPPAGSNAQNLLDTLLPGDGLRTDLNAQASAGDVVSMVAEDATGLGFTPMTATLSSDVAFNTIALDDLSGAGCVAPEQSTLEDGTYPAAQGLFLYVNAASLERESVSGLVNAMVTADAQAVVTENGFVAPSSTLAEQIAADVTNVVTGRAFSHGEPLYTIPLDLSGTVTVDTAATAFTPAKNLGTAFSGTYSGATVTVTGYGNEAAYRGVCNGDADMAVVTRPATADESAVCEQNNVTLWDITLGNKALVMVVPAAADYAACLTTEQIATLWQDQGDATVTNWSALGDSFPDLPVTIFLPLDSQNVTDTILTHTSSQILLPRMDALEKKNDPLYRAAATANIEGAITYMTYSEFQQSDANVMAVAIDDGNGCVAPDLATIRDGSYALADTLTLTVSETALARPEVQAFLWYAIRADSADTLSSAGVIPVDAAAFESYQETAVQQFAAAVEAANSAPAQEPTPTPAPTEQSTSGGTGN